MLSNHSFSSNRLSIIFSWSILSIQPEKISSHFFSGVWAPLSLEKKSPMFSTSLFSMIRL